MPTLVTPVSLASSSPRTPAPKPSLLARLWTRRGDTCEETRTKAFVITLSVPCALICLLMLIWDNTGLSPDGDKAWTLGDTSYTYFLVLFSYSAVHTYVWGATLVLKVLFIMGFFCGLTFVSLVRNPNEHWYIAYVLALDFTLVVQTENDRIMMDWVAVVMRVGAMVYVALHVLAVSEWGPNIFLIERDYRPINALMVTVSVLLLNHSLVRSYASSAREEIKQTNKSVEMCSHIAMALVNFDLDAADRMMRRDVDFESPILEPLDNLIRNLRTYKSHLPDYLFQQGGPASCSPNEVIPEAMAGKTAQLDRVASVVSRLREIDYSLKDFHADISEAFPELELYRLEVVGDQAGTTCTSGRTGEEEYQRTMGAMYTIYCVCRLDMDGKQIFSFGVDDDWKPLSASSGEAAEKRRTFFQSMDWDKMLDLFVRADLLRADYLSDSRSIHRYGTLRNNSATAITRSSQLDVSQGVGSMHGEATYFSASHYSSEAKRSSPVGVRSAGLGRVNSLRPPDAQGQEFPRTPSDRYGYIIGQGNIHVNSARMTAFLVLTAIHDVMKNPLLLPTVQKKDAPYRGVAEGSQINDHDLALAYVMEAFPGLLPSFDGLEPGQRAPVIFSQSMMGFNNGWLVQGEAPPGALFTTFKEVIMHGRASESDINFYFAHWLTDLAGAEPYDDGPWPGSDKFVVKFPLKVLNAFLESFAFVDRLAERSEVEVMESYLQSRWSALGPPVPHIVEGCSVAAMRVALMAQGFEAPAVAALQALAPSERDLIATELARTGLKAQFQSAPAALKARPAGPALLVYYAPALIQKAGAEQVAEVLLVLAAVYRAARELFPLESGQPALESTVVIRIDTLKVRTPAEIRAAGSWHLRRTSPTEAEAATGGLDAASAAANASMEDVALIDLSMLKADAEHIEV